MLKKYNIAINISFWILVTSIIVFFSIILSVPDLDIDSIISGSKSDTQQVIVKENPVIITKYQKVKEDVEWYYFVATAYSKNDPSQGTNSKTATGKDPSKGIIAVDPDLIPYGTELEIKDMGVFVAEDCGGKIRGNRIDIYFNDIKEAKEFGRQGVWIRFTEDVPVEIASLENFKNSK